VTGVSGASAAALPDVAGARQELRLAAGAGRLAVPALDVRELNERSLLPQRSAQRLSAGLCTPAAGLSGEQSCEAKAFVHVVQPMLPVLLQLVPAVEREQRVAWQMAEFRPAPQEVVPRKHGLERGSPLAWKHWKVVEQAAAPEL
jgi:hypothetical protein